MKIKNLLFAASVILTTQAFTACNTAQYYNFAGSSEAYHSGKAIEKNHPGNLASTETASIAKTAPENLTASNETELAPVIVNPIFETTATEQKQVISENVALPAATKTTFKPQDYSRKEIKKALKQLKKSDIRDVKDASKPAVDIVELIFAIFLPPVGVLLHEGGINDRFWISLVLTLLFFIPGLIYALLVVTDTI